MKPTNKLERRVLALSQTRILGITKNQKQWAFDTCLDHKGFANKTNAFCLDCGDTFTHEIINRKRAVCPSCNTKIKILHNRKSTDSQTNYFAIAEIVEEFQVIRHFEIKAFYKKGEPVRYDIKAILEDWIMPDLKFIKVGRVHNTQGFCDFWGGDWSIRSDRKTWYTKYDVYPRHYHPKSNFKREYRKYGINHNLKGLTFIEAVKIVPNNPHVETLLKAKQYGLVGKGDSYEIRKYWPSIKICLRNRYKVKEASDFIDYLELLRYFNKDLRNAKFVCPKNLSKEHDRLVSKKREIERRQKIENQRKRIIKDKKEYEKQKCHFFGLVFRDKNITIRFLNTVSEFMEEGDIHKHCLFTNEYYKKPDSLVFSALVDNKPMETIEVSKSKLKVVQSRGLFNNSTEHHDAIISVVNKNMDKIRKIVNKVKSQENNDLSGTLNGSGISRAAVLEVPAIL